MLNISEGDDLPLSIADKVGGVTTDILGAKVASSVAVADSSSRREAVLSERWEAALSVRWEAVLSLRWEVALSVRGKLFACVEETLGVAELVITADDEPAIEVRVKTSEPVPKWNSLGFVLGSIDGSDVDGSDATMVVEESIDARMESKSVLRDLSVGEYEVDALDKRLGAEETDTRTDSVE